MGTSPSGYNTPKTNWQASDVPTASDFNRIEGNINAIETGSRTIDPAQVPSGNAGTLRQFLDWLANRIKAITGKANWWDTPVKSIQQLADDHAAHLADDTKHVTKDGTLQTGLNADKLDGNDASAFATANHTHSYLPLSGGTMTGILTAQNNTSYTTRQVRNITLSTADPSGGGNGDVWLKYTP